MLYLILFLAVVAVVAVFFIFSRLQKQLSELKNNQKNDQALQMMQSLMQSSREQMDSALKNINDTRKEVAEGLNKNTDNLQRQLHSSTTEMNKRLDNAAKVIGVYSKEIGGLKEIGRKLEDFQDLLKSPKLRGNVGEHILRDLLEQILPRANFDLQYKFKEGQAVDAIIKTDKGIIPIDSKFPMENFRAMLKSDTEEGRGKARRVFVRDVKKHITDISKKYILPKEGTVDFAVMYVPAEAIWYEIVKDDIDLNNFAQQQKVMLVSPNSFYYFLQVVMMGMRGKRIEDATVKVMAAISDIQQETGKFGKDLGVMGRHITNAKNASDNVATRFVKLSGKIEGIDAIDAPKQAKKIDIGPKDLFE